MLTRGRDFPEFEALERIEVIAGEGREITVDLERAEAAWRAMVVRLWDTMTD